MTPTDDGLVIFSTRIPSGLDPVQGLERTLKGLGESMTAAGKTMPKSVLRACHRAQSGRERIDLHLRLTFR